jgi:hypothetical protein
MSFLYVNTLGPYADQPQSVGPRTIQVQRDFPREAQYLGNSQSMIRAYPQGQSYVAWDDMALYPSNSYVSSTGGSRSAPRYDSSARSAGMSSFVSHSVAPPMLHRLPSPPQPPSIPKSSPPNDAYRPIMQTLRQSETPPGFHGLLPPTQPPSIPMYSTTNEAYRPMLQSQKNSPPNHKIERAPPPPPAPADSTTSQERENHATSSPDPNHVRRLRRTAPDAPPSPTRGGESRRAAFSRDSRLSSFLPHSLS